MKKWHIVLIVAIVIVSIAMLLYFMGYGVRVTTFLKAQCATCNADLSNTTDCRLFMESVKNDPDVLSVAKSVGVDTSNIDYSKTIKGITYPSGEVYCEFYE